MIIKTFKSIRFIQVASQRRLAFDISEDKPGAGRHPQLVFGSLNISRQLGIVSVLADKCAGLFFRVSAVGFEVDDNPFAPGAVEQVEDAAPGGGVVRDFVMPFGFV